MLDQNDIKKIGTLLEGTEGKLKKFVHEELEENNKKLTKEIVEQVRVELGEFITENVLVAIDDAEERLSGKINTLPTKEDLSRAVADVKGEFVAKLRKEDEKANLHIKFSHENKVLTEEQWKALRALQVFPSIEI